MNSEISGIDHLMLSVKDSAAAGKTFARMGFAITPRGQLPGMSNRLICFANQPENAPNFVELMSLDDPETAPPAMAEALKTPNRPVLIVAASGDAATTQTRLSDGGLHVSPVIDGGRDWTLDNGEVIDLAFSIVLPAVGQAPFYWIACQHKTPQHYLRADFVTHENGATQMSKIIAVANNPLKAARHYAQMWTASIVDPEPVNAPVIVDCGHVQLHIHSRESFGGIYPGINLNRDEDHIIGFAARIGDIGALGNYLKGNGFRPWEIGRTIVLEPSQCNGCLVVFEGGDR